MRTSRDTQAIIILAWSCDSPPTAFLGTMSCNDPCSRRINEKVKNCDAICELLTIEVFGMSTMVELREKRGRAASKIGSAFSRSAAQNCGGYRRISPSLIEIYRYNPRKLRLQCGPATCCSTRMEPASSGTIRSYSFA